jgi:Zn-dependent protease
LGSDLVHQLPAFIVVVLSLTVHEFAHAWTAHRLGDDTAARMGRLTLNPIPHIDLFGTILLPLILASAHLPPIGWAKPVPVNRANFKRGVRMSVGDILVSLAGPLSNLGLALLAAVALGLLARFAPDAVTKDSPGLMLPATFILVNVSLALFNIVPVPPLDGSHVLGGLLPASMQEGWNRVRMFGPLILLALIYIPVRRGGDSILFTVLAPARDALENLLLLVSRGIAA